MDTLLRAIQKKAFQPHGKWSAHTTYVCPGLCCKPSLACTWCQSATAVAVMPQLHACAVTWQPGGPGLASLTPARTGDGARRQHLSGVCQAVCQPTVVMGQTAACARSVPDSLSGVLCIVGLAIAARLKCWGAAAGAAAHSSGSGKGPGLHPLLWDHTRRPEGDIPPVPGADPPHAADHEAYHLVGLRLSFFTASLSCCKMLTTWDPCLLT